MKTRAFATLLLTTAVIAGCGSSSSKHSKTTAPAPGGAQSVVIQGFSYKPAALTVTRGSTITVTNRDSTAHTATVSGGGFDTGTVQARQSKTISLNKAGTYTYICQFHPFMRGQITVSG